MNDERVKQEEKKVAIAQGRIPKEKLPTGNQPQKFVSFFFLGGVIHNN